MLARCRRHVLKLHHVHSNSIDRVANAWGCLRMPECISISVARSSLSVCIHPHALLWYTKHPIHIGPSARRTPRHYGVSTFRHLMAKPDIILTNRSEKSYLRKASSSISRGQSIFFTERDAVHLLYKH